MLLNTKDLYGRKLAATDGLVGHVRDFYFDDKAWVVRYVVADTGSWLPGRLVLLSPRAFANLDERDKTLHVNLRIKQIENSPSIATHKPVSRRFEQEYHSYYAWPPYWQGPQMWGMASYPFLVPPADVAAQEKVDSGSETHLRSATEVAGYGIEAVDGPIGRVSGLLIDSESMAVRDLVVEAGPWYSGREILIPLGKVTRIAYEESKVHVQLKMAEIRCADREEAAAHAVGAHFHD
jgi:hypothetical protein